MSAKSLADAILNRAYAREDGVVDMTDAVSRIGAEFDACQDRAERGLILAVFVELMRFQEKVCKDPADAAIVRDTSKKQYNLFLLKESFLGDELDAHLLRLATDREVCAGRMNEEDNLRKLAVARDDYLTAQPKAEPSIARRFKSLFKRI